MNPTLDFIHGSLIRDLKAMAQEISAFPDGPDLWHTPPGIANAAGNLAVHVAGNLQFFVGGVLGGSGYVRDRDRELNRRSGSREEVLAELDRAREQVQRVLPMLTAAQLAGDFPAVPDGPPVAVEAFLVRLCAHSAYHRGQLNYLRRMLVGQNPVS